MKSRDRKSIAIEFNDCINRQDINGLAGLMAENHTFFDRDGTAHGPKARMVDGWKEFFKMFPKYRNTFEKIEVAENLVSVLGFAYWTEDEPYDPVIWTAIIEDELITEWRVHEDSPENRKKFNLE